MIGSGIITISFLETFAPEAAGDSFSSGPPPLLRRLLASYTVACIVSNQC